MDAQNAEILHELQTTLSPLSEPLPLFDRFDGWTPGFGKSIVVKAGAATPLGKLFAHELGHTFELYHPVELGPNHAEPPGITEEQRNRLMYPITDIAGSQNRLLFSEMQKVNPTPGT